MYIYLFIMTICMDERSAMDFVMDGFDTLATALISLCADLIAGLIKIGPGLTGGLIGSTSVWLIAFSIILIGFKRALENSWR